MSTVIVNNEVIRVIRDEPVQRIVREAVEATRVLAVAKQGPPGPPGPSGAPYMVCTASGALSGHRAVRGVFDDRVVYASAVNSTPPDQVLGITLHAAMDGQPVNVQTAGKITEPSWSWLPDLPIFLGVDGALTQVPPTTGVSQMLAMPVSPTAIVVHVQPPFVLE